MSIVLFIISRLISFSGLSFLLFTMTSTIAFSAFNIEFVLIWWPCLVVSRLHGNDAVVSGPRFSDLLRFFCLFSFNQPTQNQGRHSMLTKKSSGVGGEEEFGEGHYPSLPGKGLGVKFSEMPFPHFETYFRQISHCKLSVFRSVVNYTVLLKEPQFITQGKHLLFNEVSCIPFPF